MSASVGCDEKILKEFGGNTVVAFWERETDRLAARDWALLIG